MIGRRQLRLLTVGGAFICAVTFLGTAKEATQQQPAIGEAEILHLLMSYEAIQGVSFSADALIDAVITAREMDVEADILIRDCYIQGTLGLWRLGVNNGLTPEQVKKWPFSERLFSVVRHDIVIHNTSIDDIDGYFPVELQRGAPGLDPPSQFMYSELFAGADAVMVYAGVVALIGCDIGSCRFPGCFFLDTFSVKQTIFHDHVNFQASTFYKTVVFDDVTFDSYSCFSASVFWEDALFRDTNFAHWDVVFDYTRFESRVDFFRVKFAEGSSFRDVLFRMRDDETRVYFQLMRAWQVAGYQDEADYYFCKYMRARRTQKHRVWRVLEWFFVDVLSGYGTKWESVLGTWGGIILLSTLVLWWGRGIERPDGEVPPRTLGAFLLSLYFSIVTFTTLGYGDFRPRKGYKILACCVSLLGAFMMALFVLVFARKFMQ